MADSRHLILATVIDVHRGWVTYPACSSCYSKLCSLSQSHKLHCPRCQKLYETREVQHRYRLTLSVADQTVCREITIFGSCLNVFFGTDATTFSSYMMHAERHHQPLHNILDLLQTSLGDTLVGHPFYFGFKSGGQFSTQGNGKFLDPRVSLARLDGRDDNLVAVQMIPPLQTWNSPSVTQKLAQNITRENIPFSEKGDLHKCISDGHEDCLFRLLSAYTTNLEQDEKEVNSVHRGTSLSKNSTLTSSRGNTTHAHGSAESSSLSGRSSFSLSIPSFRLSCDGNSSLKSTYQSSRLSLSEALSFQTAPMVQRNSQSERSATCVKTVQATVSTAVEEATNDAREESPKAVTDSVVSTLNSPSEKEIIIERGDSEMLNSVENVRKDAVMSFVDSKFPCGKQTVHEGETRANKSTNGSAASTDLIRKVKEAENNSRHDAMLSDEKLIAQAYDSYMNHWLQDNSFDGWTDNEFIQELSTTHSKAHHHEPKSEADISEQELVDMKKGGKGKEQITRSSFHNISSTMYEFPDDLPFSEDLDEFLQDVEAVYMQTKVQDVDALQSLSGNCNREAIIERIAQNGGNAGDAKYVDPNAILSTHVVPGTSKICKTGPCRSQVGQMENRNHNTLTFPIGTHCSADGEECDRKADICTRCNRAEKLYTCNKSAVLVANTDAGKRTGIERTEETSIDNAMSRKNEGEEVKNNEEFCFCAADHKGKFPDSAVQCTMKEASLCASEGLFEPVDVSLQFVNCSQSPLLFSQSSDVVSESYLAKSVHDGTCYHYESQDKDFGGNTCIDNSVAKEKCATPQQHRRPKYLRQRNTTETSRKEKGSPSAQTCQDINDENVPQNLLSNSHGTPCLFSQVPDDSEWPSQRSAVFSRRMSRLSCHSKKISTPLRELFLRRARSWKMSSTPRSVRDKTEGEQFGSPACASCGTPDLFSSDDARDSPESDEAFHHSQQENRLSSRPEITEIPDSFECTPDLF